MESQLVPLDVVGVRIELPSKQPVVVLRGAEPGLDNLHVAVLVGPAEANAIAMAMEKKIPPRPMTHDLLAEVMTRLGSGVRSVEIGMLDSSTYRGTITLGSGRSFDARASDAIAVAVRVQCLLTMEREMLTRVGITPRTAATGQRPISEDEIREFRRFLDDAEPGDFE